MNNDSFQNYFTLKKFSLLYDHYAFIDAPEYYADQLFIKHKVTVRFGREYKHPDQPYVIIFCKVRKHDGAHFLAALGEMNRKMILCGYPGYEEFCRSFIAKMTSGAKALRKKRCNLNEAYPIGETEQASSKRAS
ncbi:MAG: hypothetical protein Q4E13_03100 [Clostridia bacterium]|nr:hypothetical protein [Clostridia bacterium]